MIQDYIENKIISSLKKVADLHQAGYTPGASTIELDFYPIIAQPNGDFEVDTGTKNNPAGITNFNSGFVYIYDALGESMFIDINEFKDLLKKRWHQLEKGFNPVTEIACIRDNVKHWRIGNI